MDMNNSAGRSDGFVAEYGPSWTNGANSNWLIKFGYKDVNTPQFIIKLMANGSLQERDISDFSSHQGNRWEHIGLSVETGISTTTVRFFFNQLECITMLNLSGTFVPQSDYTFNFGQE